MDIRGVEKLGKAFTESTVFLDFALRCERSNMVGLTVDGWTRNRVCFADTQAERQRLTTVQHEEEEGHILALAALPSPGAAEAKGE